MATSTMDRSSLRFVIKKEHGNHYIVKRPTTTTFSSLFSSLNNNNVQQRNNNNPSSDVLVTEDDRVCLHFSVGDPSCPECNYNQQQLTTNTNNKKRKRRQHSQTLKKNKKAHNWVCEKEDLSANSSNLCFIIKKVQGKYSIHPTRKQEQQNNNNNNPSSSSSSVLTHDDVIEDDRVCLHFSVGDPSCPQCDYQQQLTNNDNNKKRKRPQQPQTLKKNKKARIINNWEEDEEEDDGTICLHLLLGSSSCIPTCCLQTNNNIDAAAHDQWEIKKVLEKSDVCLHLTRLLIGKDVAQKFVFPVLLGGVEAAMSKEGVPLQVRDVDTDTLHSLFFKYWVSAKSHIFTKRWVKDFVNRRDLKKGDKIGLRWDQQKNRFEFSVLGRAAKVVE